MHCLNNFETVCLVSPTPPFVNLFCLRRSVKLFKFNTFVTFFIHILKRNNKQKLLLIKGSKKMLKHCELENVLDEKRALKPDRRRDVSIIRQSNFFPFRHVSILTFFLSFVSNFFPFFSVLTLWTPSKATMFSVRIFR